MAYDHPYEKPARFPVQWVIRPRPATISGDYRGYAGQLASGALRLGDEVSVLPERRAHADRGDRHLRRRARGGDGADVADAAPGGRARRLPRRADLPSRARPRRSRASWRRTCAGWPSSRCGRAARYLLKHTSRNATAVVDADRRPASTCTRSSAQRRRRSSRSTTSAACACARAPRSCSTPTRATAARAASS